MTATARSVFSRFTRFEKLIVVPLPPAAVPVDFLTWQQSINSIGRAFLNEDLLREALAVPAIRVFFQHKVQAVDFDRKTLAVRDVEGAKDVTVSFDFCVGADGSYSIIRRQLMRVVQCV